MSYLGPMVRCVRDISIVLDMWEHLATMGVVPSLYQEAEYRIYTLKKDVTDQLSFVFSYDQRTYVSIEVVIRDTSTGQEAVVISREIDTNLVLQLKFYMKLVVTGYSIVKTAQDMFDQFLKDGGYEEVFCECKNFAVNLLKGLGVEPSLIAETTRDTTEGTLSLAAIVGATSNPPPELSCAEGRCKMCDLECFVQCVRDYAALEEMWERISNLGFLPALDQLAQYKVYTLKKGFADHMSAVISYDKQTYVSIEVVIQDNGPKKESRVISRIISTEHVLKLEFYKDVAITGQGIIRAAKQVFEQFVQDGEYQKVFNNCQHYAINVLKALGVDNAPLEDGTKATLGTLGAGAIFLGLIAIRR
eukprot:gene15313-6529_t